MSTRRPEGGDLLQQILTSRHFAHAGTLKRVLVYLYERSREGAFARPKEYQIATEAMGRGPDFDPQRDPVVRVTVSQIRKRLAAFFASEGAALPWRLEIPPGRYVTVIRANEQVSSSHLRAGSFQEFWSEHRQSGRATLILYTEPLFFTDSQGLFVRHWQVNDEAGQDALKLARKNREELVLRPVYHYLSAGEMRCLLSLSRCLTMLGIATDFRNSRQCRGEELDRCNAVLLGSPRTNSFLNQLQEGLPLRVLADSIELRQHGRRRCVWRDGPTRSGGEKRLRCWAVLSRIRNPDTGAVMLFIASNHGAAIEGTGQALTLEEMVGDILDRLGRSPGGLLPSFQLLVEVIANQLDGETLDVKLGQLIPLPEACSEHATATA